MHRIALLVVLGVLIAGVTSAGGATRPSDGRYSGEWTGANQGSGKLRLRVGNLRPGLHGVRLLEWSATLRCADGHTEEVDVPMTAARADMSFSGYVTFPGGKHSLTGRFTRRNAMRGTIRVVRGAGAERCDTGALRFTARRAGR
jgi:hypothetical protein